MKIKVTLNTIWNVDPKDAQTAKKLLRSPKDYLTEADDLLQDAIHHSPGFSPVTGTLEEIKE